jgi:hypothetical protein
MVAWKPLAARRNGSKKYIKANMGYEVTSNQRGMISDDQNCER